MPTRPSTPSVLIKGTSFFSGSLTTTKHLAISVHKKREIINSPPHQFVPKHTSKLHRSPYDLDFTWRNHKQKRSKMALVTYILKYN